METLSIDRSAQFGNAIVFTATFKEVRVVESETVKVPQTFLDDAIKHSAQPTQTLGKQPTNSASNETSDNSSTLYRGYKNIGSIGNR